MSKDYTTPLFEKYGLTIEEAADYFGIGQKKLRLIINTHPHADFVRYNGVKVLIKRRKFENFSDNTSEI